MNDNFCMICDTYLINDGKCACGLTISAIRDRNNHIRKYDTSYPVKNPFKSNRALTSRERASLEYKKRLSSINGLPKG